MVAGFSELHHDVQKTYLVKINLSEFFEQFDIKYLILSPGQSIKVFSENISVHFLLVHCHINPENLLNFARQRFFHVLLQSPDYEWFEKLVQLHISILLIFLQAIVCLKHFPRVQNGHLEVVE